MYLHTYCNGVLAGLPANQLNRLQSVLHAAARLIYGASRRDHVKPLLRLLHWLSVPERVEFKLCVLTYRCLHGLGPDYFSSEFTRVSDLHARRSASTAALIILLHYTPHLATGLFLSLAPGCGIHCQTTSPLQHLC